MVSFLYMQKNEYTKFNTRKCVACQRSDSGMLYDVAHVYTRKAWPEHKDKKWNCPTLCRLCHIKQGSMPIAEFAEENPTYKHWLIDNGWYFFDFNNKWRHPKAEIGNGLLIETMVFSLNEACNDSIKKKLQNIGIVYLDDLETIDHFELFKIKSFGEKKYLLVEAIMQDNQIRFKDGQWLSDRFIKGDRERLLEDSPVKRG